MLFGVLFLRGDWGAGAPASAGSNIGGSSSGIFINPAPASAVVSGVGTDFFTWGIGFSGSPPSSLRFSGTTFTADFDELFSFGTLTFFNGRIAGGTGAEGVDLEVTIVITMPSGVTRELVQTLTLINTPNVGTPEENADLVNLPASIPAITFTVDEIEFTLEFVGFGTITGKGGATTIDRFFVLEEETASAELLGRVVPCTAAAGFHDTLKPVPGPEGGNLRYKANISRGAFGFARSVAVTLCNPNPEPVKGVVCSMANMDLLPDSVPALKPHDRWLADFDEETEGPWTCTRAGSTDWVESFHFGCQRVEIPPGGLKFLFDDEGVLPPPSPGEQRVAPYIDFLRDGPVAPSCSVRAPDGIKGVNQFLIPIAAPGTFVNVWTVFEPLVQLSNTLGGTLNWPTGNWFTMGNPDTYLARLNGTVIDAPTGSVLTFRFPPGSLELERTFVVPPANPDNPTCLGLPVEVSEPFVIPPGPEAMSLDIEVPEECSALREGTEIRFEGEAVADEGSPVFEPGEFIVQHSGTWILDNTPPQIEQLIAIPLGGELLDVQAAAIDEITMPIEALLRFRIDGGPEELITMGFDEPPTDGVSVFFRQTIGPFPPGSTIELTAEVFDDVGNSATSPPLEVIVLDIDIKPNRFPNIIELETGEDDDECEDDSKLRVAILTTADFDALTVDPSTVQMGDPALGGLAISLRSRARDVDRDKDRDLLLTFSICDLLANAALDLNTTELVLVGNSFNGIPVIGSDSVRVLSEEDEDD